MKKEALLYAVHGLLHLCGFDDRTARDFDVMHQREDEILCAIGVGAVFARGSGAATGPARGATRRTTGDAGGIRK